MRKSVKLMMEAANAAVPKITPAEARDMIAKGNTLVLDAQSLPKVRMPNRDGFIPFPRNPK